MSIASFYNCLIDVYSTSNPRSLSGGMKVVSTLKQAGVPCRITDDNAGQQIIADGRAVVITHTVYTAYTGWVNGDTAIETTPGSSNARFRFLGRKVRRAQGSIPQFLPVLMQEVNN